MSRLLPPPSLSVNMEKTTVSELTPTRLGIPNEFPYEFDSPAFSPGFTSPGNTTETEEESSDDEEDFLAGLTRRLAPSTHRLPPPSFNSKSEEKRKVAVTSPQSTLSGLGSRSPIIPPSHAHRDNAWDVISAAAGEVAKLKLGSYEPHLPRDGSDHSLFLRRQNAAFLNDRYIQQQRLLDQMWLCSQTRVKPSENHFVKRVVNEELAFENLRYMKRNALSNATWTPQQAVTPLKRPSAGTGVFLPRRYPTTTPSEPIKKSTPANRTAMPQSKVNPPQTLSLDEFNNLGSRLSQFDYDCMLARSTLLARQGNFRAVGCLNQERRLPQDWMY